MVVRNKTQCLCMVHGSLPLREQGGVVHLASKLMEVHRVLFRQAYMYIRFCCYMCSSVKHLDLCGMIWEFPTMGAQRLDSK